jgi:hypothetical protein
MEHWISVLKTVSVLSVDVQKEWNLPVLEEGKEFGYAHVV